MKVARGCCLPPLEPLGAVVCFAAAVVALGFTYSPCRRPTELGLTVMTDLGSAAKLPPPPLPVPDGFPGGMPVACIECRSLSWTSSALGSLVRLKPVTSEAALLQFTMMRRRGTSGFPGWIP